jgi:DNA recombination protein RmuC
METMIPHAGFLAIGLTAGLLLGWLITRSFLIRRMIEERAAHGVHKAAIEGELKAAAEKIARFEEMKTQMTDSFRALSAQVMQENNQAFIDLAGQTFSRYFSAARQDFENREKAVRECVRPVSEALEKYDRQVQAMENARQKAYGELSQQVLSLSQTQNALQRETGKLVNALRMPHVRGRWGEITLRRVVELSGMQNQCDFFEQQTAQTDDGAVRPDMIIRLPGDRRIIVDSKVPLTAYLDALESETPDQAEEGLKRHARHVQAHIQKLAAKEYWNRFTPTPEFVVLFMPGENFFSAALGQAPGLIEEASNKGVILATPTTLISLLKAVAYGWKQETAAENARAISALGSALYNRLAGMVNHLNTLGKDLDRCITSYNTAVGSFERRVLPSARRFDEMGVTVKGGGTIASPNPVDNKPRTIN